MLRDNHIDVLIIGGVHGDEYSSSVVVYGLMKELEKYSDKISIRYIPNANRSGGLKRKRECEDDKTNDLNRHTFDECANMRSVIKSLIEKSNLVIDVHNSPNCSNIFLGHTNVDYSSEFNLLKMKGLENKLVLLESAAISNARYAKSLGKLAFTYEFKGMDLLTELQEYINEAISDISKLVESYIELSGDVDYIKRLHKINKHSTNYNEDEHLYRIKYSPVDGFVIWGDTSITKYHKGQIICAIAVKDTKNNGVFSSDNKPKFITISADEDIEIIDFGLSTVNVNSQLFGYKKI